MRKASGSGILSLRNSIGMEKSEGGAGGGITAFQILRRLGGFVWPKGDWMQKATVASSVALMIAGRAVSVAIPFVFRSTVDRLNAGKNATKLVIGCMSFLLSFLLASCQTKLVCKFVDLSIGCI
jgi:hypothetical protein